MLLDLSRISIVGTVEVARLSIRDSFCGCFIIIMLKILVVGSGSAEFAVLAHSCHKSG